MAGRGPPGRVVAGLGRDVRTPRGVAVAVAFQALPRLQQTGVDSRTGGHYDAQPTMAPRLHLFGPPLLVQGGATQALPFDRRHQLLAYLALRRAWVPRREVAALLWPAHSDKLAYTNLRKTLFRLPELPWAAPVDQQDHTLRCAIDTDVADFASALQQQRLDTAVALRRGDLLAGFEDIGNPAWTEWLQAERDQLQAAWRAAALDRLGDAADADASIALSAQLLAIDPYDDDALRHHIEALRRAGQTARAQAAWRQHVDRLQRELGVEPAADLRAWHAALGATAAARPAAVAGAPPRPARDANDGFVGRGVELRDLARRLQHDESRLFTVIGPGGVGKTRLVRRLIDEVAGQFGDGAAFVPLEDVVDGWQIGTRVAQAVGVPLPGHGEPLPQLIAALQHRHLLLVLDNVEHLVAHADRLRQLLHGCAALRIVVTSRVRLAIADEQLCPLHGLPCPDEEDADRLETFDAARLFIRAAERVEPALVPAAEAGAIVEICRLVDGLPLALELAAAWTRLMSCATIADELRRDIELLSTADPTRPPRQASIAAVFEQSWSHLGEPERRALARLSVFRGGFTAEAARQVAEASAPVLAALADRSLLHKGEGTRLLLHPLVQQFADRQLCGDAERHSVRLAHGRHYLQRLAQRVEALRRADVAAMRDTELEFDNLRAGLAVAAPHVAPALLGTAAHALMNHCDHRGRWIEGWELLDSVARALAQPEQAVARAALQVRAAHLAHRLDRYAEAEAAAAQGLEVARRHDDLATELQAAKVLGATSYRQGRMAEAAQRFESVRRLAGELGDVPSVAAALANLSIIARSTGRLDEALDLSTQACRLHRELGNAAGEALSLNNRGILQMQLGQLEAARAALLEARALCERHQLPTTRSLIENNLADLAWRLGDAPGVERHAREALALTREAGQRGTEALTHHNLMRAALMRGALAEARDALCAGQRLALEIGQPALLAAGAYLFAELLAAQGEPELAGRMLSWAMRLPSMSEDDRRTARIHLQRWGQAESAPPDGPGLPLASLAQRIATEGGDGHAALIRTLREHLPSA